VSLPGEPTLLAGSDDGMLRYWDLGGAQPREQATAVLDDFGCAPYAVPAGGHPWLLTTGPGSGLARLWSLVNRQPKLRAQLPVHGNGRFSADGNILAFTTVIDNYKGVRIWNLRTEEPKEQLLSHPSPVTVLAVSADGRLVASSQGEAVRLWDLAGAAPKSQPLAAKVGVVHGLAFSPDSRTLIIGGDNRTLQIWDVGAEKPRAQASIPASYHWRTLIYSPDGKYLAGCNSHEGVFLWDTATWNLRKKWPLVNVVNCVAFVGGSRHLALGNVNGTTYILRLAPPGQ
jgi:WD40 repeat protein